MSLTVIITDDDPVALFLQSIVVRKCGLREELLNFNSGKDTLEYLRCHFGDGKAYVILLDINMPDMNGWQLLDAIAGERFADNVYVVMVSSSIDISDRRTAKGYKQVVGYFEKPIDKNVLKDFFRSVFFGEIVKRYENHS
jgi:CheY-like chemotaxis protein